jgi:hypothetical protein
MSTQQHISGDIAFIKFSSEPVGILEYHSGANLYEVRRRIHSKTKGAYYVKESYYAYELESEVEHSARQREEYDAMARSLKAAGVSVLDDRQKGPSFPPTGGFAV